MSDLLRDPVLSLVMLLSALGIAQGFLLLALIMTLRQIRRQIRALSITARSAVRRAAASSPVCRCLPLQRLRLPSLSF